MMGESMYGVKNNKNMNRNNGRKCGGGLQKDWKIVNTYIFCKKKPQT